MESCVADTLSSHVQVDNNLLTDKQWAYRKGLSTELLLAQLTETWRKVVDANLVVGVAFVDFRKAFDCVSHSILIHKLHNHFGIHDPLLSWITNYLKDRSQFVNTNGNQSDIARVTCGIPQGSVLGPILYSLYTSDMPNAITSGTTYMYADDTTIYCTGKSIDVVTERLNKALNELYLWCLNNSLTPHPSKCEAMIMSRGVFQGPLNSLTIGAHNVKWVSQTRLLGVNLDNKLDWSKHVLGVRKSFVNKLCLLKRSRSLQRHVLMDLYFKVILPSITYALPVWGGCLSKELFNTLETLHTRAARIICNFPRDMPTEEVHSKSGWDSLSSKYKLQLATLVYKMYNERVPPSLSTAITKRNDSRLRGKYRLVVPRFNTYYMKYSISHRGAIVWNALADNYNPSDSVRAFYQRAKKEEALRDINFNAVSVQNLRKGNESFVFY